MQYMVVVSDCNIWWWCLVMQYLVVVSGNAIYGGGVL